MKLCCLHLATNHGAFDIRSQMGKFEITCLGCRERFSVLDLLYLLEVDGILAVLPVLLEQPIAHQLRRQSQRHTRMQRRKDALQEQ